jgi:hypothetical protein
MAVIMEPSMWHVRAIPWKAAYGPQVIRCHRYLSKCFLVPWDNWYVENWMPLKPMKGCRENDINHCTICLEQAKKFCNFPLFLYLFVVVLSLRWVISTFQWFNGFWQLFRITVLIVLIFIRLFLLRCLINR